MHVAGKDWYVSNLRQLPNTHTIQLYMYCIKRCYWPSTVHALCSIQCIDPSRRLQCALTSEHNTTRTHLQWVIPPLVHDFTAIAEGKGHISTSCSQWQPLPLLKVRTKDRTMHQRHGAKVSACGVCVLVCIHMCTYIIIWNMYCIIILHILYYYKHILYIRIPIIQALSILNCTCTYIHL